MQRMRSQIEQLQSELLYLRGDCNAPAEDIKILKHTISLFEASKMELQTELQECRTVMNKRLEQKEAEMKQVVSGDPSVLKQHYEKKVHDLELEKRALQNEIEELRHNLSSISSNSDDSAQKLKEEYLLFF